MVPFRFFFGGERFLAKKMQTLLYCCRFILVLFDFLWFFVRRFVFLFMSYRIVSFHFVFILFSPCCCVSDVVVDYRFVVSSSVSPRFVHHYCSVCRSQIHVKQLISCLVPVLSSAIRTPISGVSISRLHVNCSVAVRYRAARRSRGKHRGAGGVHGAAGDGGRQGALQAWGEPDPGNVDGRRRRGGGGPVCCRRLCIGSAWHLAPHFSVFAVAGLV